jgi:SAM-dependent methyltransferase
VRVGKTSVEAMWTVGDPGPAGKTAGSGIKWTPSGCTLKNCPEESKVEIPAETAKNPNAEQFKEQIRAEWTDSATVSAWRKWHSKSVVHTREATDAIVRVAHVAHGLSILDLASGTGEPALTLASAVGPEGHVVATDLGAGMLALAEENAQRAGLTNLTFQEADAHVLPFGDETFDRVTCRFGVMYFADVGQALREIRRVLKAGGLVALAAWGPVEQNPISLAALGPFLKRTNIPPPPPGAPHPFRFASPGSLAQELERAGFARVEEHLRTINAAWPGPPEEFWEHFRDIAVAFQPIMDSLTPDQRQEAISEVIEGFAHYYDGQSVNAPVVIVLATGVR